MKRSYILLLLLLNLNFVSAFSMGGTFYSFDVGTLLDVVLFLTIFTVIFFTLKKSPFKENVFVCWIISLCVSSFGIYGILSTGFSFENLFYSLGMNSGTLATVLWIIGIVIIIFLMIKFKVKNTFGILFGIFGSILILFSILGQIYYSGVAIAMGIGSLLIALFLLKGFKRR